MKQTTGLLFAGDLLVAIKDPDTGLFGAYEKLATDKFEIKAPSDPMQKTSKGRETFGNTFLTFYSGKPVEFSLVLDEINHGTLAMNLAGRVSALAQTGAAITDETVTVVKGKWVECGHEFLDLTALEVTNSAGTTTYVKDVDYLINPRLGLILATEEGAIASGDVKLTAATRTLTGTTITGGKQYSHVLKMKLDGINLIDKQDIVLDAPQATVSAQDAFDFLSGKLASVPLKGVLEVAPGQTYPFRLRYPNAA